MRSLALSCLFTLVACQDGGGHPTKECQDIACDLETSRTDLLGALDTRTDVIADFLRANARDDGSVPGDYRAILRTLDAQSPCSPTQSFMVLSNQDLRPKALLARCADQPELASRFFMALPNLNREGNDMEPRLLHIAAWDEPARQYRRYAAHPDGQDGMLWGVEPKFCQRCHGGPRKLTTWQPLMNEMDSPWSQWIATPGFVSQMFDEYVDQSLATAPHYAELTAPTLLTSASRLQPLIESGIDRFIGSRLESRKGPVSLEVALSLLQPLFCDESINYVSEEHRSGQLLSTALVDRGTQFVLRQVVPEAEWVFLRRQLQFDRPATGEQPVTFIPVRGRSTIEGEIALVSRRVLSAVDVLRVRAVDWSHPVGSEFRCQIFERGKVQAAELDVSGFADNKALVQELYRTWMAEYEVGQGSVVALEGPKSPRQTLTFGEFGDALERNVVATMRRSALRALRNQRFCAVARELPTAPQLFDLTCR